ncbi:glycosyltransferase family 4 protein [Methyloligella sp. 2.7D]|uniref:glycosyltransferase family 4 protein n=1 Tax=unclassified Methyloligella TaxID=2625955 RepID=UPI00157DFD6D|nr:glycosyltransferase family 4 protein [Methyloligella sp. GL2]QKP76083.1 glycosyltransferase family 4 protein [Methyloligella sp. GL2]
MARPTILQIVPRVETGGSEQSALEINAALTRAGATSLVVSEGGALAEQIAKDGGINIYMKAASKNPAVIIANAFRLRRIIAERNVDLLHARSRAPAWSALMAARMTGKPFVTTYHGSYSSKAPFKTLYNSVMARGDTVIANSRFTAKLVHERHGTPYEKMPVIFRGIDTEAFDPAAVSEARLEALRKAWGISPKTRVVLQAARLTHWKGQRYVIEAAGLLQKQGQLGDTVFVLAGGAQGRESYAAELNELIAQLGLGDHVLMVGHCADMAAAQRLADISIVASTQAETFGRASIEAQAMGAPVIVTDIGAAPETLIPENTDRKAFTGWIVPPADSAGLAARLASVLSLSHAERESIAARATTHAREVFSLRTMQSQTLEVYDEILGARLLDTWRSLAAKQP